MDVATEVRQQRTRRVESAAARVRRVSCQAYVNLFTRLYIQGLTPESLPSTLDRETLTSALRLKRRNQWLTATVLGGLQALLAYRMRKVRMRAGRGPGGGGAAVQIGAALVWLGALKASSERGMETTVRRLAQLPPSSALGNEVRIILAELEGPEGPVFREITDAWLRSAVMESRGQDQESGRELRGEEQVHPQFALTPRIWTRREGKRVEAAPLLRGGEDLKKGLAEALELRKKGMAGVQQDENRYGFEKVGREKPGEDRRRRISNVRVDESSGMEEERLSPIPKALENQAENSSSFEPETFTPIGEMAQDHVDPFDFAAYAKRAAREDGQDEEEQQDAWSDGDSSDGDDVVELTPSQRRAAERAERRRAARERREKIRLRQQRPW